MTDSYYGYSKEIHELAKRYIAGDIIQCASCMVNDMLNHSDIPFIGKAGFSYENIENLYDDSLEAIESFLCENLEDEELEEIWEIAFDEREARAYELGFEPEPNEIYEWWQVSGWLFDKLRNAGQPVLSTDYGKYWGRCTTGQAIILDGTMQEIAGQYAMYGQEETSCTIQ